MTQQLDYFFTSISPFTYLGHLTFLQIAKDAEAKICYKPMKLGQVFAKSGATPLPERPECRLAYRFVELERWAKKRDLPITLQPAHFPTDPSLADRCVIALQEQGYNPGPFIELVLSACWAQEMNIADEGVIRYILTTLNINDDRIIHLAESQEIHVIYDSNTADAIEQGVLGAPAYFLEGEQFWGQDRLELLADTLR